MPPFEIELLIRFTIGSSFIFNYCYFSFSHFGIEGGSLVLVASVPGQCLHFSVCLSADIVSTLLIRK